MAVTTPRSTGLLAADLGTGPQSLLALQPPPVLVTALPTTPSGRARTEPVHAGPFTLRWQPLVAPAATAWLGQALRGERQLHDGQLLVGTVLDNSVRRALGFSGAALTGWRMATLDATDKQAFWLELDAQPEHLQVLPAGGKLATPVKSRKALLVSNFRVSGLPAGASAVMKLALAPGAVAAPTARPDLRDPPGWAPAPPSVLNVQVGGRDVPALQAWADKLLATGQLAEADSLNLTVDLLDSTLKTALLTLGFADCRLRRFDSGALTATTEGLPSVSLTLDVGQAQLTLPAG